MVREVTAGGFNSIRKLLEARLGVKIPKGTIPDRVLSFLVRQGSQRVNPTVEKLWSEVKRGMVESAINRTETEPGVQAVRRMQEKTDDSGSTKLQESRFQTARGEYHPYPNIWTYYPSTDSFEASTAKSSEIRPPSRQYSEQLRDIPEEVRDDFGVHQTYERPENAEVERDYIRNQLWAIQDNFGPQVAEVPRSSFDEHEEDEEQLKKPPQMKAKPKTKHLSLIHISEPTRPY